jgi:NAD(P)-dependent dehydrogenase (short-subunit alcohol dehydrogenase family)
MSLSGKTAVVTGGGRGIGAAIAMRLAELGCDVGILYASDTGSADRVVAQIEENGRRGLALRADSADQRALEQAIGTIAASLGGLDILVNNAGIGRYGMIDELSDADIDAMLAVNIRGVVSATRAALSHMRAGGRIVMVGSCLADRVASPGFSVYALTKSALTGLTHGLARDLGPRRITVNIVHPGPTDTDANPADGPQADYQRQLLVTGTYSRPEDIAAMVAFLVQPAAANVTGAAFAVDGGANV